MLVTELAICAKWTAIFTSFGDVHVFLDLVKTVVLHVATECMNIICKIRPRINNIGKLGLFIVGLKIVYEIQASKI